VLGGTFGKGITFSQNDRLEDSSINESLTVKDDGQMLYLSQMLYFGWLGGFNICYGVAVPVDGGLSAG